MRPLAVLILVVGALAALLFALTSIMSSDRVRTTPPSQVVRPAEPTERPNVELPAVAAPTPRLAEADNDRSAVQPTEARAERPAFGGEIEGVVLDPEGFPVANAKVNLMARRPGAFAETIRLMANKQPGKPVKSLTTDGTGTFKFSNLDPEKPWTLLVSHEDFTQAEEGPIPVSPEETRHETIRLEKGLFCEGYVRDAASGTPIPGAKLVVDSPLAAFVPVAAANSTSRLETETDATGRYVFENVTRGQKTLIVSADGYATQIHNNFQMMIQVEPERQVINNKVQRPTWRPRTQDFDLKPGLTIAGRVVGPDHAGFEGASIEAISQTGSVGSRGEALSLAGGEFLIEGVAEGIYSLKVTAEGFQQQALQRISAGDTDVQIVLAEQGVVEGRVVLPDGRPLTRAFTVKVRGVTPGNPMPGNPVAQSAVRAPKGGAFRIENVPAGQYAVEAISQGFASSFSEHFEVTQGVTSANIEVRMSAGGTLTGTVHDPYTGEPIVGAEVSTNDNNWMDNEIFQLFAGLSQTPSTKSTVRTDAQGKFEIKLITPGDYQVKVKSKGYTTLTQNNVAIRPDETFDLGVLSLTKGATLGGIVYSPEGTPEPGATVQLRPVDNSRMHAGKQMRSDANGRFFIENVAAGTYKLYAQRRAKPQSNPWDGVSDMRNSEIQITIADGSDYNYDLSLARKP